MKDAKRLRRCEEISLRWRAVYAFEICRPGACGANLPAHARALFASGSFTFAYTRSRSRQMRAELARQGRSRAEVLIGLLEPELRCAFRFEPEHELQAYCARGTAVMCGARYAYPRRAPDWHWSSVWQALCVWWKGTDFSSSTTRFFTFDGCTCQQRCMSRFRAG